VLHPRPRSPGANLQVREQSLWAVIPAQGSARFGPYTASSAVIAALFYWLAGLFG